MQSKAEVSRGLSSKKSETDVRGAVDSAENFLSTNPFAGSSFGPSNSEDSDNTKHWRADLHWKALTEVQRERLRRQNSIEPRKFYGLPPRYRQPPGREDPLYSSAEMECALAVLNRKPEAEPLTCIANKYRETTPLETAMSSPNAEKSQKSVRKYASTNKEVRPPSVSDVNPESMPSETQQSSQSSSHFEDHVGPVGTGDQSMNPRPANATKASKRPPEETTPSHKRRMSKCRKHRSENGIASMIGSNTDETPELPTMKAILEERPSPESSPSATMTKKRKRSSDADVSSVPLAEVAEQSLSAGKTKTRKKSSNIDDPHSPTAASEPLSPAAESTKK